MGEQNGVAELINELPTMPRPAEWCTVSKIGTDVGALSEAYERKLWIPTKSFVEVGFAAGDPVFLFLEEEGGGGRAKSLWVDLRPPEGGVCDHGIVASAWPLERLKKGEGLVSSALGKTLGGSEGAPNAIRLIPLKALLMRLYATRETRLLSHRVSKCSLLTLDLVSLQGQRHHSALKLENKLKFAKAFLKQMLAKTYVGVGMPVRFTLGGADHLLRISGAEAAGVAEADGLKPVFFLVGEDTECVLVDGRVTSAVGTSSRSFGTSGQTQPEDEVASSAPAKIDPHTSDLIDRALARAAYVQETDFSSLGGLRKEIKCIRRVLSVPWRNMSKFAALGLRAPKGILLHGSPGTGKTRLAYAAAKDAGARLYVLNGPDLVSQYQGESEAGLRALFEDAKRSEPSVIFIDEIDAIVPSRESNQNLAAGSAFSDRITAELLSLLDQGLGSAKEKVVVIGATNRIEAIDKSVRRPGRFDYEVEVGVPAAGDRLEILTILLGKLRHCLSEEEARGIAVSTHGFTGADLKALCNEASLLAMEDMARGAPEAGLGVSPAHFEAAKRVIVPSAMREVLFKVPDVKWEDIGGRTELKKKLNDIIKLQTKENLFEGLNIKPLKGILLYGPPGCSKTMLVKAVASQSKLNFINIKGPELLNKYVGESEKAIRTIFTRAKAASPSIIFIDEIDGLVTARTSDTSASQNRVLTQLLTEIDNIRYKHRVAIIGATNRPDRLDLAILRPGRFDWLLYVPPPDLGEREAVFRCLFAKTPLDCSDGDDGVASSPGGGDGDGEKEEDGDGRMGALCGRYAAASEGYSPADLLSVVRQAAISAIEEDFEARAVKTRHVERALISVQPSLLNLDPQLIEVYRMFERSGVSSSS